MYNKELIEEIDIYDEEILKKLAIYQLALTIIAMLIAAAYAWLRAPSFSFSQSFLLDMLLVVFALFVTIVVHELLHVCAMKLCKPAAQIKLLVSMPFVGVSCAGNYFSRAQYIVILLTPLLVLSLLFSAAVFLSSYVFTALICFVAQFSGAAGDVYMACRIVQSSAELCEDTEKGLRLYRRKDQQ